VTLGKSGDGVRLSGNVDLAAMFAGKGGTGGTDDLWDAEELGRDTDDPDRERADFTEMDSETMRVADAAVRGRAEADSVIDVLRALEAVERREAFSASLEDSSGLPPTLALLTSSVAVEPLLLIPLLLDCTKNVHSVRGLCQPDYELTRKFVNVRVITLGIANRGKDRWIRIICDFG